MLIFRKTTVLAQHLVLSFSLGDCSVHRLREDSLVLSLSVGDSSESQDRRGHSGIVTLRR